MEIKAAELIKPQAAIVNNKLQALPPAVQRVRELIALLSDERLFDKLGAERVESIEKNENGYLVYTENYTMQVNVHYISPAGGFCGPAKFELEFCEPVSRKM